MKHSSLSQVQENHEVITIRMNVGPVGSAQLKDCTFRPLLLRGSDAEEVAPYLTRVAGLFSS